MAQHGLAARGTDKPWYQGWELTEAERAAFRATTIAAQDAKRRAQLGLCELPKHPVNVPRLDPESLMPLIDKHDLRALSLFSGGGGMDIGFDRAGYRHVASFDVLEIAATVLRRAKPDWKVFGGSQGDVTGVHWTAYKGLVDVLHGGPPCQPFSHAGRQKGRDDVRDMIPALVRAVTQVQPEAFVCENVSGLLSKRFEEYVQTTIYEPLANTYTVKSFVLNATDFGVPQKRRRVFFIGFKDASVAARFTPPSPTHADLATIGPDAGVLKRLMGAREALGLSDIGTDGPAPTIRSGFTGPRHTTSVLSSVSALRIWDSLGLWPNGVAQTREKASAYVTKNGNFRLSVSDCLVLQGFPADWPLEGPVYQALGLIGNSVAPPMAYQVAQAVRRALRPATL